MMQQDRDLFTERLNAMQARIEDMRTHLEKRGDVAAGVKAKLAKFFADSERLKQSTSGNQAGAKALESALETWIDDVDKEYGSPPKRVNSASL